jgi:hypothetical protein
LLSEADFFPLVETCMVETESRKCERDGNLNQSVTFQEDYGGLGFDCGLEILLMPFRHLRNTSAVSVQIPETAMHQRVEMKLKYIKNMALQKMLDITISSVEYLQS